MVGMTEADALNIVAVRVVETADRDRAIWTDADRAWASHAAAAAIGESGASDQFVAQRARLALERLHERVACLPGALRALAWRPWVGTVIIAAAFAAGLLADRVGSAQRINVLAPPVLLLLIWNLLVYLALFAAPMLGDTARRNIDPLRRLVTHLGTGLRRMRSRHQAGASAPWVATIAVDWARMAAPLYQARAARILHLAAAALALGVIAGLYLRGMVLEYRASWESTFLDPAAVQTLLAIVLAPGAGLGGMRLPDLERIAAMRVPGSENAAPWLHLLALTMLAWVVLPRLLLAVVAAWRERRRVRALSMPLEQPYFRRLLRGFHVAPNPVQVVPYAYTPTPAAVAGLEILLARLVGGTASVRIATPAAYGDDDDSSLEDLSAEPGPIVLLFNLAATPEREAHCAFAIAATARASAAQPLLVLVDETSFKARAGDDPQRVEQRRAAWRDLLRAAHVVPAFVDLATPDLTSADAAMDAALFAPVT